MIELIPASNNFRKKIYRNEMSNEECCNVNRIIFCFSSQVKLLIILRNEMEINFRKLFAALNFWFFSFKRKEQWNIFNQFICSDIRLWRK